MSFGTSSMTQTLMRAQPLAMQSLAFGSVGASYVQMASFTQPIVQLIIYSSYNSNVLISFDGVNDFMEFPAGYTLILNEKTNGLLLTGVYGIFVKQLGSAITGATQANPCVLTSVNSLVAGQTVTISGVVGMTQLNGNTYTVLSATSTTITIDVNSTAFTAYISGGTVTSNPASGNFRVSSIGQY